MSLRSRKITHRTQPTYNAGISKKWKDKKHVLSFNAACGLSEGHTFSNLSLSNSIANLGVSAGFIASSSTARIASLDELNITGPLTIIVGLKPNAISGDQCFMSKAADGWYNTPFACYIDSSGYFKLGRSGTTSRCWYISTDALSASNSYVIAMRSSASSVAESSTSSVSFFVNGTKSGSALDFAEGAGGFTSNTNEVWLGDCLLSSSSFSNIDVSVFHIFSSALSDDDLVSLTKNPYSIFEPRTRQVFTAAAGSNHATSGALANTGATLAGIASNYTIHATNGTIAADGAALSGTALHSFAVEHETSGALAGWGAEITGYAVNGTVVEEQQFSGGYTTTATKSKPLKKRKKVYEIDPVTGDKTAYSVIDEDENKEELGLALDGADTTDIIVIVDEESVRKQRYKILAAAALLTAH